MNNPCIGCRFADWKRTAAGRLHPDKTGRCTFQPIIILPLAAGSYSRREIDLRINGYRFIERGAYPLGECDVREPVPEVCQTVPSVPAVPKGP
jgi:hypothetical protein